MATETPTQSVPTSSGSDGGPPRRPPRTLYDTSGRKRKRPMWLRIVLWTMGSLLALVLVVAAVVGWWAHGLVDKIQNVPDAHVDYRTAPQQPYPPDRNRVELIEPAADQLFAALRADQAYPPGVTGN